MAQSAVNAVILQQNVVIPNRHGEKLVGLLHDTGSVEIVVLCHGFRSTKEDTIMVNLATALEKEGISAFRFDFAGNGESEGTFQYGNYFREADDLHAVVEYFSGANHVISAIVGHSKVLPLSPDGDSQITMVDKEEHVAAFTVHAILTLQTNGRAHLPKLASAHKRTIEQLSYQYFTFLDELGGDVVLLYASKFHDVHTVVNVSGRYDMKKGIKERIGKDFMQKIKENGFIDVKTKKDVYRVTEESLLERLNTDMHEACLKINKECRALTVHGSADEIIPVEDAVEFDKIIPNHKLQIIEGADHCYNLHQPELLSIVVNFIKATMEEDKKNSTEA